MENWEEFPNVVGAIDTTPHEIYRPLIEPQRPFYSGYRHYHCMNTQLVMDNEGHIRFVQAGFLGSTHDAVSFNTLLSKRRVKIEHIFKEVKTYKAIGQIWRHPRWLMPVCVELVALLSERRVRLFKTV